MKVKIFGSEFESDIPLPPESAIFQEGVCGQALISNLIAAYHKFLQELVLRERNMIFGHSGSEGEDVRDFQITEAPEQVILDAIQNTREESGLNINEKAARVFIRHFSKMLFYFDKEINDTCNILKISPSKQIELLQLCVLEDPEDPLIRNRAKRFFSGLHRIVVKFEITEEAIAGRKGKAKQLQKTGDFLEYQRKELADQIKDLLRGIDEYVLQIQSPIASTIADYSMLLPDQVDEQLSQTVKIAKWLGCDIPKLSNQLENKSAWEEMCYLLSEIVPRLSLLHERLSAPLDLVKKVPALNPRGNPSKKTRLSFIKQLAAHFDLYHLWEIPAGISENDLALKRREFTVVALKVLLPEARKLKKDTLTNLISEAGI